MIQQSYLFKSDEFFRHGCPIAVNTARHDPVEYPAHAKVLNKREFWKIFYVLSGNAVMRLNRKRRTIGPGFIGLCHPDDLTTYEVDKDLSIYNVLFLPSVIGTNLRPLSDESEFFSIFKPDFKPDQSLNHDLLHLFDANRSILSLIRKMYREFESENTHYVEMLRAELIELLIELSRISARKYSWQRRGGVVASIDDYLEEHFFEPLDLGKLAARIGYSRGYLLTLYHKQTERTIGRTLLEIRLNKVKELLRTSTAPVTSLCYQCGFSDIGNFYRMFCREEGMTPCEYRQKATEPTDCQI